VLGGKLAGKTPTCLSHGALDRLALGEATPAETGVAKAHLAACDRCAAAATALAADRDAFAREASLSALAADALARASTLATPARWRRWLPALGVVAAAAVAVVVVRPQGRVTGDVGFQRKGNAFALSLYVLHAEAAATTGQLHAGEPLHPGDRVRPALASPEAGFALVLGIDDAHAVTTYYPTDRAEAAPLPAIADRAQAEPVAGAIELDGTLGRETLVALRCREPVAVARAVAAVKTAIAGGKPLPGQLGLPCSEARYVIEKVAP
jgi:hypothetical protein